MNSQQEPMKEETSMCDMCNGATLRDLVDDLHREITDRGFTVMSVEATATTKEWSYTIGLLHGHDHPELVVAGYPWKGAVAVLAELAAEVVKGDRFDEPGDHIIFHSAEIGVVPVHAQHLTGDLLAAWHLYSDAAGRPDLEPRALQIVLPDGDRCFHHQTTQPRLDKPGALAGMNRRERRRQRYGGGRRSRP
jgi:hypothetical protein